MTDAPSTGEPLRSKTHPAFQRCVRCSYRLRGLPENHACPECGLRFDEECELYRVHNPKVIFGVFGILYGSGWVSLKGLGNLGGTGPLGGWDVLAIVAGIFWVVMVVAGVFFVVRLYRRGQFAAVTGDGLFIRMAGRNDELIAWHDIADACVKPDRKCRIVALKLRGKAKTLELGSVFKLFPRDEDLERFIRQVNDRRTQSDSERQADR